jgi:hypothetical protein
VEGGWQLPQLRRLAYNYVQLESAFDQLVPKSRRSNSNHYCRSNLHAATAGFSRDKGAALGLIKSASSIGSLRELLCAPADSRYMKMNLMALDRSDVLQVPVDEATRVVHTEATVITGRCWPTTCSTLAQSRQSLN